MKALLRLYPKAWRVRYETEVAGLLDERGSRFADVPDLLAGALDARLHPVTNAEVPATKPSAPMSLRHAGWAAIVGGLLWIAAYVGVHITNIIVRLDDHGIALQEGQEWLMGLFVAPALLVFAQMAIARTLTRFHRLASVAVLVSLLGAGLMIAKLTFNAVRPGRPLLGDTSQPELWVVGMCCLVFGSLAFGIAMLAAGRLRRRTLAALLVGSVLNAAFLLLIDAAYTMTALRYSEGIVASGALFGLGWVIIGQALLREDRARLRGLVRVPADAGADTGEPATAAVQPAPATVGESQAIQPDLSQLAQPLPGAGARVYARP